MKRSPNGYLYHIDLIGSWFVIRARNARDARRLGRMEGGDVRSVTRATPDQVKEYLRSKGYPPTHELPLEEPY